MWQIQYQSAEKSQNISEVFPVYQEASFHRCILYAVQGNYQTVLLVQIPVDWCVHSRISGAPILK